MFQPDKMSKSKGERVKSEECGEPKALRFGDSDFDLPAFTRAIEAFMEGAFGGTRYVPRVDLRADEQPSSCADDVLPACYPESDWPSLLAAITGDGQALFLPFTGVDAGDPFPTADDGTIDWGPMWEIDEHFSPPTDELSSMGFLVYVEDGDTVIKFGRFAESQPGTDSVWLCDVGVFDEAMTAFVMGFKVDAG